MKVAIILAEFGTSAPATDQFRRFYSGAEIRIYDSGNCPNLFASHERWGWRMNDYYKVRMLLDSQADIAISFDADMRIVSRDASLLPLFAERFGLCLPANPRHLVRVDTTIGADSDRMLDETNGAGYAYNCSPIALNLHNERAVNCARTYCELMIENPVRGPLAWWRAAWKTGYAPYLLPPQWCVCEKDIGCGDEIILHDGHEAVRRHYE